MANNLIAGYNSAEAMVDTPISELAISSTNCQIIYEIVENGSGFISHRPESGINALNNLTAGTGYIFVMKQPADLTDIIRRPGDAGGGAAPGGTVLVDVDGQGLQV